MIIEPLRGVIFCEILPEDSTEKGIVDFPEKIENVKIAVLKALIDPDSKEFVKTDYVKFGVGSKYSGNSVYINTDHFELLRELYLSESSDDKLYGVFEFPEKIWFKNLEKRYILPCRKIDENILEVLKGLEYV